MVIHPALAGNSGAYSRRSAAPPEAKMASMPPGKLLLGPSRMYLYRTGFVVNTPSSSTPCQLMRIDGGNNRSALATGCGLSMVTVGALVNEKNARSARGPTAPLL